MVCESGEASQIGSCWAAVWGEGRETGLGAEMECCSCRSKRVLGAGQASGLCRWVLRSLPSVQVPSVAIGRGQHRRGSDVGMKKHLRV